MIASRHPEHFLAPRFRALKVPVIQLSATVGRPYSTVNSWMKGIAPMPLEIEGKLQTLLYELDQARPPLPIQEVHHASR